jgi:O-glycosyl hydrolase
LIHLDPTESTDVAPDVMFDGEIVETKLLWALGNFSRFVRLGMQRIEVLQESNLSLAEQAGSFQSIGFKDEDQGKLVLVFINHREKPGKINLNCAEPIKDEATMYVTDETRDLAKSTVKTEKLAIPARSVSTFILELD